MDLITRKCANFYLSLSNNLLFYFCAFLCGSLWTFIALKEGYLKNRKKLRPLFWLSSLKRNNTIEWKGIRGNNL